MLRRVFRPAVSVLAVITFSFAGLHFSSLAASAANTKKLVGDYLLQYTPDKPADTSEYMRITLGNGNQKDLDQFVTAQTSCMILRPTGNNFIPFLPVPVPLTLRINGGQLFIDCRFPKGATFAPNDLVMVQVAIEPKDANGKLVNEGKFRPTLVQWRDGDGGVNGQSNVGKAKIAGFKFKTDPEYTAYNDLDSSVYSPSLGMDIKNLEFLSDQPESIFGINDENATVKGVYDASLNGGLGSISLPSPGSEQTFINPFSEPHGDLFSVAEGQLYDADTGAKIGAFVEGVSAVPEPGSLMAFSIGTVALAAFVVRKRRAGA